MRRLICTVRDKRGINGDCMDADTLGNYVEFDDVATLIAAYDKLMELARLASLIPHDNDHNSVVVKTMAKELLADINEGGL